LLTIKKIAPVKKCVSAAVKEVGEVKQSMRESGFRHPDSGIKGLKPQGKEKGSGDTPSILSFS
jgi:hypothetical protein